ncbi:UDP glucose 6-dehydrogenase [Saccharothrix sp. NRRL B-16348]|uniref:UDP-glucose dehydrogenase family protein n=1 Tax=Saccharothrix sp. NRRL B-16348 TaxID=1415542 RepID=UPI0006AE02F9|nr:UDP-glucose/GDP-mannose dehydrogenase family protein [Saccharothrix sp. NRRL B-16348]KOX23945.1 UDP glucose 6-dehydrogenase [Saccharothrix sp. NRRL B-16348]
MAAERVVVIGAGYVGLTTAACLAGLGHRVVCADVDPAKVERLRAGAVDILEPRLPELVAEGRRTGRLAFALGAGRAMRDSAGEPRVVFLCVPTPSDPQGRADLGAVEAVLADIEGELAAGDVLVVKSTVPIGATAWIGDRLGRADVGLAANPEFLREGTAVHDFLNPDRIVVGASDAAAASQVARLYDGLDAPLVSTDPVSAELIKYASNGYLAVRLSYVNDLAALCEAVGGDIGAVTAGMGHDPRIGSRYLAPGPGWGGSCLPKDSRALLNLASARGVDLAVLRGAADANREQRERVVAKILAAGGGRARVAVLGLTFKAGTNDLRDSPAVAIAERLAAEAEVVAYDPAVRSSTTRLAGGTVVDDVELAVKGAAVVAVLTDWPEFRALDWVRVASLMEGTGVVDVRNHLDPAAVRDSGLHWYGTGWADRGTPTPA